MSISYKDEVWKEIIGFEKYKISNYGRILGCNGNILKFGKSHNGYQTISLYNKGVKVTPRINRLVGLYFIPNPENKPQINHIDGIKTNNHVDNLEWCTISENVIHSIHILGQKRYEFEHKKYGDSPRATKVLQYSKNNEFIKEYGSISEAKLITNISATAIVNCCVGLSNSSGGYIWKYKNKQK